MVDFLSGLERGDICCGVYDQTPETAALGMVAELAKYVVFTWLKIDDQLALLQRANVTSLRDAFAFQITHLESMRQRANII